MCKKIITSILIGLLILTNCAYASSSDDQCSSIRQKFQNDVGDILTDLTSLESTVGSATQAKLENYASNIMDDPTDPNIQAICTILASIAPNSQMVPEILAECSKVKQHSDDWKSTEYNSRSCRDKYGCMLGEPLEHCMIQIIQTLG